MTEVAIAKGENVYEAARNALDHLDFSIEKDLKVMIKPNLTKNSPPESGVTTNSESVRAVLERINSDKITIGEGSGGSTTRNAFRDQGYEELSEKFDVELKDFDKGEIVEKKIPNPNTKSKIPFARSVVESDFIVSAAKLKTHSAAGVTLSMKNMFGAVPLRRNKLQYHFKIDRAIPDFMKVIKPDLCLVEGFPGNQGDETVSNPVDSNIVIAGRDPLTVDVTGSLCMGVDPEDVKHIQLMKEQEGVEEFNIDLKGEKISDVALSYSTEIKFSTKLRYMFEKAMTYL